MTKPLESVLALNKSLKSKETESWVRRRLLVTLLLKLLLSPADALQWRLNECLVDESPRGSSDMVLQGPGVVVKHSALPSPG